MLAGFRLTYDEWEALDEDSKRLLLQVCAETSPPRVEDSPYETFQIEHD